MTDGATGERRLSGTFRFLTESGAEAEARFSMVADLIDGWTDEDVEAFLSTQYEGFALAGTIQWQLGRVTGRGGFHQDCRWGREKKNLPMLGVCKCPHCKAIDEVIIRETSRETRIDMWTLREEKIRELRQWM